MSTLTVVVLPARESRVASGVSCSLLPSRGQRLDRKTEAGRPRASAGPAFFPTSCRTHCSTTSRRRAASRRTCRSIRSSGSAGARARARSTTPTGEARRV